MSTMSVGGSWGLWNVTGVAKYVRLKLESLDPHSHESVIFFVFLAFIDFYAKTTLLNI